MLSASWNLSPAGDKIVIHPKASGPLFIARYLLGGTLLLGGLYFLKTAALGLLDVFKPDGAQFIAGVFITTVFALALGPLGWYIVFAKNLVEIDAATSEAREISDWILGRKIRTRQLNLYSTLRISCDLLRTSSDPEQNRASGNLVSLEPIDADTTPRLEIAWFEERDQQTPRRLASDLANLTKLPVDDAIEIAEPKHARS